MSVLTMKVLLVPAHSRGHKPLTYIVPYLLNKRSTHTQRHQLEHVERLESLEQLLRRFETSREKNLQFSGLRSESPLVLVQLNTLLLSPLVDVTMMTVVT